MFCIDIPTKIEVNKVNTRSKKAVNIMRKIILITLGLLAAIAWPNINIIAVEIDTQGSGQVLIFPYYTIRDNNDVFLQINNTTADTKALKVQVLEGDNGQVTSSLNVYLGAFDVWTATISINLFDMDRLSAIGTRDNSCAVTNINGQLGLLADINGFIGVPLDTGQFTDGNSDGGRQSIDRTREGYIQVIEMGTISGDIADNIALSGGFNCQFFIDAWGEADDPQSVFTQNPQLQMQPPTGGLTGQAIVINLPGARAAGYDAIALDRFYVPVDGEQPPSLHTSPADPGAGLAAAFPPVSNALVSTDNGMQVVTDTWTNGLQAVDAVLMANRLSNQFASELVINGKTEWVVTFPGKREHVSGLEVPVPPYSSLFASDQSAIPECEFYGMQFFNRNQVNALVGGAPIGIPPAQPLFSFCYEVNVLTFNNSVASTGSSINNEAEDIVSDLWASRLFTDINTLDITGTDAGRGSIMFNDPFINATMGIEQTLVNPISNRIYQGLPVVGVGFQGAISSALNALFGVGAEHNYQRVISPEQ